MQYGYIVDQKNLINYQIINIQNLKKNCTKHFQMKEMNFITTQHILKTNKEQKEKQNVIQTKSPRNSLPHETT